MTNPHFTLADLILVLLLHNCFSLSMESANITTDELALLAFKANVHDPQNLLAANWSISTSVCNWIGVSCGSKHQRVTVLSLSNLSLTGTLPPHLGNLSFLSFLNIEENGFEGSLPVELANLHRLRYISLANNNFAGELPSWFGSFPKLESLYLQKNFFTGVIPSSLCYLPKLEILDLHENNLKGQIPADIGNLPRLKMLYLRNNQLSGSIPSSIFNISSLQVVELKSNYLTGSIPFIPLNLSSLQIIDLGFNNLTGHLPPNTFDLLPELQNIYLDRNLFSGGIPAGLVKHEKLQVLFLSHNQFEGTVPEGIGNLTTLKALFVGWNNFKGEIPRQIGDLIGLEMLSFAGLGLLGSIPVFIGNLTLLTTLDLSFNNFTGAIPPEIRSLSNLEVLYLGDNKLVGPIPPAFFNSSTMQYLSLQTNRLSGHLPETLWLPQVEYFYLGENQLGGEIPSSLSNASQLISIELQSNFFSGILPDSFGNLRNLEDLNLQDNNFSSKLSSPEMSFISSLTNCRNLKYLYIDGNPLINTKLPVSIGNLSSFLEVFSAPGCNIKGSIPREIGNLGGLVSMNLDNNKLTGTIPATVGRVRDLQSFSVQDNDLEGSIPVDICRLESLSLLLLTNNKLSGPIPACLGNLNSLRSLFLGSNSFTSSIPLNLTRLEDILHLNLSSNSLTGPLPIDIGKWKVVIDMDLSGNQLSGDIPASIGDLKGITHLSLSSNKLQGSIPQSTSGMIDLEFLDLSRNNLSGTIPRSLEKLWNLKYFNVSFNRLEGEIPDGGAFSNYSIQSFMGNQALCGAARLHLPPCKNNAHNRSRKITNLLKYILPTVVAITILTLALIIIFLRCQKRKASLPSHGDILPLATWRRISYHELQQATDGFCESNLLGIGSFGSVYQGTLPDGTSIAVKVFNLELEKAFKSFEVECEVLRNIRHRNLVKIMSSCCNIDFKALVLEFLPNGSLEKWLYSHNHFVDILQRLNIMIDVASALEYLHDGQTTSVVHCDLKPSNILLDEDMGAHLGDFGIAKLLGEEGSVIQTMTLATIGYMAPEYGAEGIISIKCDVYSFGILLMEIFTRKKPTDEMFSGEMSLKNWVQQSLPSAVIQVVDKNLLSSREREHLATKDCALSILQLGSECSADLPEERIDMKNVVLKLKKIKIKFLKDLERVR
ncbi:receptor kinase-like protein Xa21 [Herrania umbratica]|uniref:non-specific serine/threonine protein kinase n=1 Tax=Herrania umbratica TaxID=108875 RepID=A0A6J1APG9_9ROSI|nr:receptor kinase-like protein Xa21 [Herrania umbratica]